MKNHHNAKILPTMRLVLSLAILGMVSSMTHTFYLDHQPVELSDVAKMHRSELETHTGSEYQPTHSITDPRRLRGPRRSASGHYS